MTALMTEGFSMVPRSLTRDIVPERKLDAYDIAVFVALAARADKAGYCWPSMQTIATESGAGRTRVAKSIERLRECGLVEISSTGRGSSHRYRVRLDAVEGARETSTKRGARQARTKRDARDARTKRDARETSTKTSYPPGEQGYAPSTQPPARETSTKQSQGSRPNKGLRPDQGQRTSAAAPAALRKSSAPLPQPLDEATDRNRVAINFAIPMPEFEHLDDWVRIAANDPAERLYTPGAPAGTLVLDRLALAVVNGEVDEDDLRTRYSAALAELRSTAAARGWVCADVLAELRTAASVDPALHRLEIRECDPAEPGMPRTHTTTELSHYPAPSTEGAKR